MGHCLNKRQAVLAAAYLPLEERQKTLVSAVRGLEKDAEPLERAVVVVYELSQAQGQAIKGQFVARQDQLIGSRNRFKSRASLEPVLDRIGLRLVGVKP